MFRSLFNMSPLLFQHNMLFPFNMPPRFSFNVTCFPCSTCLPFSLSPPPPFNLSQTPFYVIPDSPSTCPHPIPFEAIPVILFNLPPHPPPYNNNLSSLFTPPPKRRFFPCYTFSLSSPAFNISPSILWSYSPPLSTCPHPPFNIFPPLFQHNLFSVLNLSLPPPSSS